MLVIFTICLQTKFIMKKNILTLFVLLVLISTSCKKDEQPTPDLSGDYTFESATLVDGNILDLTSTDLVILNATTDTTANPPNSLTIQKGESANTSNLVELMLALSAPCKDANINNWKYAINFKPDNILAFICSSENNATADVGTWALEDGNNTLKLEFSSGLFKDLTSVPISLKDVSFTDGKIKGTIKSFPLMKDLDESINSLSNIQLVSFDIVLTK